MSLSSRINDAMLVIGQECKGIWAALSGKANTVHAHSAADVTSGTFASARIPTVSQAQAEAGTVSSGFMTPLRTRQAFDAFELRVRPPRPRAVFIGPSNVVPGTWPEALGAEMGWTVHNFAVGGTGFGHGAPDTFEQQVIKARDSAAFPNSEVGFVFIAGGGNDVRASYGGTFNATTHRVDAAFAAAKAAWPNARIITIPVLWGAGGVHQHLYRGANVIRASAEAHDVEVIWHAWEWLIGFPGSMADAVHPNATGYATFRRYIKKYLRGESTAVNHFGALTLASGISQHSNGIARVTCIDGVVSLEARVIKNTGSWAIGDVIGTLPAWASASQDDHNRGFTGGQNAYDRAAGFYIYPASGQVQIRGAEPAITSRNEANLGPVTWPIGG